MYVPFLEIIKVHKKSVQITVNWDFQIDTHTLPKGKQNQRKQLNSTGSQRPTVHRSKLQKQKI